MTNAERNRKYIPSFSYFRVLMTVYVVIFHWLLFVPKGFSLPVRTDQLGGFSVSFFCLLSGFLLGWHPDRNEETGSYIEKLKQTFHRKGMYYLKYEIMIVLSLAYYLLLHFLTGRNSLSEILLSGFFDFLCLSTLLYPDSITMNAGWYFQCLSQYWVLSPFLNRLLRSAEKKQFELHI